ncbi:MAG TPA: 3-oxoacyl-ACP reductase family protein [Patescibacteria group bacterium]|nr:3-oxoacyl-ACP reductase family protein [Patescibacteria group bacterium]
MSLPLADQVIIVTGGSRGIGRTICLGLAQAGATVIVNYANNAAAAAAVQADITVTGGKALALKANVTSPAEMETMAATVKEQFGAIDVLINNAGIFPVKLFGDMSLEDWQAVINIDLTGTFLATKAVYGQMKKQGCGKIINMASVAGRVGGVGFVHYSAAKAGVIGFTKALAREAGALGIQVNAIAPGIIETDTAKETFSGFSLKEYIKNVPLGRLGQEQDLMGTILFLCLKDNNYITGQTFAVDGGYTMI